MTFVLIFLGEREREHSIIKWISVLFAVMIKVMDSFLIGKI